MSTGRSCWPVTTSRTCECGLKSSVSSASIFHAAPLHKQRRDLALGWIVADQVRCLDDGVVLWRQFPRRSPHDALASPVVGGVKPQCTLATRLTEAGVVDARRRRCRGSLRVAVVKEREIAWHGGQDCQHHCHFQGESGLVAEGSPLPPHPRNARRALSRVHFHVQRKSYLRRRALLLPRVRGDRGCKSRWDAQLGVSQRTNPAATIPACRACLSSARRSAGP
jgi:hypothetical protein